jgi:hypothetical protein
MKEFEGNYFLSLEQQEEEPVEVEQQLSPSLAQQPDPQQARQQKPRRPT